MTRVLCIDTEPDTVSVLREDGHRVEVGSLGYRTGVIDQQHDPHNFDVVIFDLRRPLCCSRERWLALDADVSSYELVTAPVQIYKRVAGSLIPTLHLLRRDQMLVSPHKNFSGADVLDAMTHASAQIILFLNQEWILHLDTEFPDWLALAWKFQKTVVREIVVDPAIGAALPELGASVLLKLPITQQIVFGPVARIIAEISWEMPPALHGDAHLSASRSLVSAQSGQSFGQLTQTNPPNAGGSIWTLPQFESNAAAARLLVSRLDLLAAIGAKAASAHPDRRAGEQKREQRALRTVSTKAAASPSHAECDPIKRAPSPSIES